jgi:hypothetical protein
VSKDRREFTAGPYIATAMVVYCAAVWSVGIAWMCREVAGREGSPLATWTLLVIAIVTTLPADLFGLWYVYMLAREEIFPALRRPRREEG